MSIDSPWVRSVGEAARRKGLHLLLTNPNFDPDTAYECVKGLVESRVAGIVLFTSVLDFCLIECAARQQAPFCLLGLDLVRYSVSTVLIDFRNSAIKLLEHLVGLGYRRIDFANIKGPLQLTTKRNRIFTQYCQRYGEFIDRHWLLEGEYTVEESKRVFRRLCCAILQKSC